MSYGSDLAFIHDEGFSSVGTQAAAKTLELLEEDSLADGLIVELGCGSGATATVLAQAGYNVLGIDGSKAMIDLARQKVPGARFKTASLWEVDLPAARAVLAIGESICYVGENDLERPGAGPSLDDLFARVATALSPGGFFLFDILEPGQVKRDAVERRWREERDWAVLLEISEQINPSVLHRRIISYRRVGKTYRRREIVHHQRLWDAKDVVRRLKGAGLSTTIFSGYGNTPLQGKRKVLLARKRK